MHIENPITPVPPTATLKEVIDKLNEIIEAINHMWHDEVQ